MSENRADCEICDSEFLQLNSHRGADICLSCSRLSPTEQLQKREEVTAAKNIRDKERRREQYLKMRRQRDYYDELHAEFGSEYE